ncbi:MAG: PEP-CTERM-box response regulator transcription factor [Opitutus sp.]
MKPKLLIVEDDEEIRTQMKWALSADLDVLLTGDRESAIEAFKANRPAVVLLDMGLPPHPGSAEEGLRALAEMVAIDDTAKVVIVSGQGERDVALKAIGSGAYDFLNKPVDIDLLRILLKRCFHIANLEREYRSLQAERVGDEFEGMLGTSRRMLTVFDAVRKVATTDAPVLILGESGTGKERIARAIHQRSSRLNGPFVAINSSAIPESLIESELFGHEKGSFTGAHTQRKGRIESSEGGTLFLDEIGEIPLPIQVKLLRFLQEGCIERVGGRQEIKVDTRVIAATNADLKKGMTEGSFREDLFYRLAVVQLLLPALRDRDDDIIVLAQAFMHQFASQAGKTGLSFGPDTVRAMRRHTWPGNVRELQNRVRRAVIMAENKRLSPSDLEISETEAASPGSSLKEARETLEREMIQQALKKHSGKITAAAIDLGISRPTFYELMDKLGIQRSDKSA